MRSIYVIVADNPLIAPVQFRREPAFVHCPSAFGRVVADQDIYHLFWQALAHWNPFTHDIISGIGCFGESPHSARRR